MASITCQTCIRACGRAPVANVCSQWLDKEGRNMGEAMYAALQEQDAVDKRTKGWRYYVMTYETERV